MERKKGNRYDPSFKRVAVALVISSKTPYARVAKQLGVGEETLRRWVLAAQGHTEDLSELTDKQRIRNLEQEDSRLRMERDILKEAGYGFNRSLQHMRNILQPVSYS